MNATFFSDNKELTMIGLLIVRNVYQWYYRFKEIQNLMQEAEVSVYIQKQNNISGLVDNLDLFDDDLMTLVFKKNIPAIKVMMK